MKYIENWQDKNLECYFCGETRSVKYETEIVNPVIDDKPTRVCMCNRCALRYGNNNTKEHNNVS